MIKRIAFPLIFLFAGLISSCKKEIIDENILVPLDTTLTMGDSVGSGIHYSNIQPILEVISPWHGGTSSEFDVDDDGVNDLYLSSSFSISPGGLNYRGCGMGSLRPEVEISTLNRKDSIVGWVTVTPGGNAYQSQNYVAGTAYPSNADTTVSQYDCITQYPLGASINKYDSSWRVDSVMLASSNNSSFMGIASSVQAGSWQSNTVNYAAIKITKGSKTVLGWLEMNVSNYYEIRIYKKAYKEL
jgi:hypothetical protein